VDSLNPNAGQVGQRRQVIIRRQPFRLEAAHLAGRSSQAVETLAIHDGPHDGILREALGVIHVFVSGETTEHRLPKKSHQEMSGVLATPRLRQNLSAQLGQSKGVIQFTIREQTGVG
jgi:hypothetical protein